MWLNKWLAALLVVALAGTGWYLPMSQVSMLNTATLAHKSHIPDFFLGDFTAVTMDETGSPRYRLQGQKMMHYLDNDTTEIAMPKMQMYRADTPPWYAEAQHGWVSSGNDTVLLQDDVRLKRLSEGNDWLQLITSFMKVRPNDNYAETDRPVTINSAFGVTHAVGMYADFKQESLNLLTQVRGDYVVPDK